MLATYFPPKEKILDTDYSDPGKKCIHWPCMRKQRGLDLDLIVRCLCINCSGTGSYIVQGTIYPMKGEL